MFRSFRWAWPVVTAAALVAAACGPAVAPTAEPATEPAAGRLVVYSGRKEPLIQPVLEAFTTRYPNVEIVLKSGDNSALANALLEERANPQADVFITTELMTVQTLYDQGVFQDYVSANAAAIPAEYREPSGGWMGITARARVIMYNTDLVAADEAPTSVLDLTDPRWQGQIAAAGSSNGSMQAHIAAMRLLIGDEATEAWLDGLLANEVTFFGGHTDVRKAVGAGEFKIGLVNHYYYYLQKAEGSPVGIIFPDQGEGEMGVVVNATAIGVIQGAKHPEAARALVDFLLSPEGQELFAQLNYEYPLVPGVPLHPDVAPLTNLRLARADLAAVAKELDSTFALMEKVGLP